MSTRKCHQCNGSGFVQTSFGPKPCPSCYGKGYVDVDDTDQGSRTKSNNRSYSYFEIFLYSAIVGVVGFFIWKPLILAGVLLYFYLLDYER